MTTEEVQKLGHGLYRIYWKQECGGGTSLASVGTLYDGSRWFAPTNWTNPDPQKVVGSHDSWDSVDFVETIEPPPEVSQCHSVSRN
jgi:hypothetical protein